MNHQYRSDGTPANHADDDKKWMTTRARASVIIIHPADPTKKTSWSKKYLIETPLQPNHNSPASSRPTVPWPAVPRLLPSVLIRYGSRSLPDSLILCSSLLALRQPTLALAAIHSGPDGARYDRHVHFSIRDNNN
jgi:hypothetical protein